MTNEEAINHIRYSLIEGNYPLPKEVATEVFNLAIKALQIADIPHQKDYVVIKGEKAYITQGHIDALLDYERNRIIEELVESMTQPFNVDLPKDFYGRCRYEGGRQ